MVKEKNLRLLGLDLARAVAALCVFIGHYRSTSFPPYSKLHEPNFLETVFYGFTSLQHESVIVFFVLSGYLVGGSVVKAGKTFSFKKYLLSRLVRLWIVLVPALIMTAIFDFLTSKIYPDILSGTFYDNWSVGPNPVTGVSSTAMTFFGNILFLQTIKTPVFGSNGPLWSLANEFWYYIMFPLISCCLGRIGTFSKKEKMLSSVILILIFLMLPYFVLFGFLAWLIGVAVFYISQKNIFEKKRKKTLFFISWICFFGGILLSKKTNLSNLIPFEMIIIASSFAPVCFFLSQVTGKDSPWLYTKVIRFFSEASYTIYAFHFPVLMFLMALLFKAQNVGYPSLSIFILMISICLLICFSFYFLFERNTNFIRHDFFKKINMQ